MRALSNALPNLEGRASMENRTTERVASINLVEIDAEGSGLREVAHMACTLDMSPHGARIIITSSRPAAFRIQGDVALTLALEDDLIRLRAQAVRTLRKSDRQTLLGVAFSDVPEDALRRIESFLERRGHRVRVHA